GGGSSPSCEGQDEHGPRTCSESHTARLARDAAIEAGPEGPHAPFEGRAVGAPAHPPARDCPPPPVVLTCRAVGPARAGVQVRVEPRLTRVGVLHRLAAEGDVVQRTCLAGQLAGLAAVRAGIVAVAADE